ncbi:hypothetical protein P355_1995 [Burkholderia cenocepacia KC-01]|nr:hypothetical protein P355_1995 [Burkholderia cenocepacia KC-01]
MKARRIEPDLVDDRRAAEQRRPRRPHDELADVDEVALAAALAEMNAIGFEVQRVRVQCDALDRGRPVELLAQLLFGDMADQRRRREEAEQSE